MADNTAGALRIGNAERDRTIALLREHTAAGRLDLDEFEERVGHVTEARTCADLDAVMVDLPTIKLPIERWPAAGQAAAGLGPTSNDVAAPGAVWSGHHARRGHRALPGWVSLSLLMIAIWAMAGFGYFWPVWIIVPTALASLGGCGRGHSVHHANDRISA